MEQGRSRRPPIPGSQLVFYTHTVPYRETLPCKFLCSSCRSLGELWRHTQTVKDWPGGHLRLLYAGSLMVSSYPLTPSSAPSRRIRMVPRR